MIRLPIGSVPPPGLRHAERAEDDGRGRRALMSTTELFTDERAVRGTSSPVMGMVLFVLARVANLSVERTTMAILPWLVPLLLSLILITYVPSISLWLPHIFYK